MNNNMIKRLKYACYTTNISMSVVGNLSPVLFLTLRGLYGISYSLLGLLVLINFTTQLIVDLIFSFFSHKFNIPKAVKLTPVLCAAGLIIYALWPFFFPNAVYIGLVIGTIIFSAGGGFGEVLISPVIAAIPAKDPGREMSKLHSIYAWGVVFVILFSTVFLLLFGKEYWQYLALSFALIPLLSAFLFFSSEIPEMETPERVSGAIALLRNKQLWICVSAIFLGGAAECTMAQWSSGYLEAALGIPKIWGDVLGVAMFSVMLGTGRTLYAKIGKNIGKVLFFSAIGATGCYVVAALSPFSAVGLVACALTGLCTAMLWPGNLIVAADRFNGGGVFIYAMMAAGGDLGASIGPQLVGLVTDTVIASPNANAVAEKLNLMPEAFGMKLGMLIAALFPLCGIFLFRYIRKAYKNK